MLFAQDKGKLIGMIGAYFNKSKENQGIANIWGFYVNENYRGVGIGKQLIEEIVNKIKTIADLKIIRLYVNQEQQPAVNVYKQAGFVIVGTENFELGDRKKHKEYILEMRL